MMRALIYTVLVFLLPLGAAGQDMLFTVVELNTENMFDCQHDSLKEDKEYTPDGARHWTPHRYWQKINSIGREIISCGECQEDSTDWSLPDIVALCEVENDTVMRDLTCRSLLRTAGYKYVMTSSPDVRGIDVALLYSPFSFRMINTHSIRISPLNGMRATRDILYVSGELPTGDTLHVYVLHAPSRASGERETDGYRKHVAKTLSSSVDSLRTLSPESNVIVLGDFNDYADGLSLSYLYSDCSLENVSRTAKGSHGAKATYRYQGEWSSLDHILLSRTLLPSVVSCHINDAPFLLEEDPKYGGVRPKRFFIGYRYNDGYSDHLPLVLKLCLGK